MKVFNFFYRIFLTYQKTMQILIRLHASHLKTMRAVDNSKGGLSMRGELNNNNKWRQGMLSLKKTAVAVLALGSSAAFAGTMGPVCTPGAVTVPCEATAWDVGLTGIYVQPIYNGWGYGSISSGVSASLAPPFFATDAVYNSINTNWNWGFKLEGSYHFNTGNDINVNWYHFDRSNNFFTGNTLFLSDILFAPDSVDLLRRNVKWDAVNAELGQYTDFSANKKIRFHGGVQYARVRTAFNQDQTFAFPIDEVAFVSVFSPFFINAEFNGFGPRLGVDYNYWFGNGFSIYGKGAAAILVGNSRFSTGRSFDVSLFPFTVATFSAATSGSRRSIVPEMDMRLGAEYTYNMAQGALTLDVGYLFVNYFNVLHNIFNVAGFPLNAGLAAFDRETNFGVQGPYVGLKYVGSV